MPEHKRAAREAGWLPKLVATDLDGTYICHGHGLSPEHRAARDWLEGNGIPVVPVTGRGPRLLDLTRSEIGEGGLLIMGQGGIVYDGRTLIHRVSMSGDLAQDILQKVRVHVDDVRIGAEDGADFSEPLRLEHGFVWPYSMDESISVDADDVLTPDVLKVFVESHTWDIDELTELIRSFVPPEVAYVTHSGIGFVEISPPNVSKAAGVKYICDRFNIDHADVLCFGDMPNDLPMFQWSGRAVAMRDGHPDVLAVADDIAEASCDFGIAKYVEGLFPDFKHVPTAAPSSDPVRPGSDGSGLDRPGSGSSGLDGSGLDGSGPGSSGLDGSGLDGSGSGSSGLDGSGLDGSGLGRPDPSGPDSVQSGAIAPGTHGLQGLTADENSGGPR